MSQVSNCPKCGGKSKIKETNGVTTYQALQDEDVLKKVGQLKKAMETFKAKAEKLEKEQSKIRSL
jgi:hypothetical protein